MPAGLTAAPSFAAMLLLRFPVFPAEVLTLPEGQLTWSFGESWFLSSTQYHSSSVSTLTLLFLLFWDVRIFSNTMVFGQLVTLFAAIFTLIYLKLNSFFLNV